MTHPPNISNRRTTSTEKDKGENITAIAKVYSKFVGLGSLIIDHLPVVFVKICCSNSNKLITTLALLDNKAQARLFQNQNLTSKELFHDQRFHNYH